MVVNDHTRSAENWKCVWYFLRPIDGSNVFAKRRYTPIRWRQRNTELTAFFQFNKTITDKHHVASLPRCEDDRRTRGCEPVAIHNSKRLTLGLGDGTAADLPHQLAEQVAIPAEMVTTITPNTREENWHEHQSMITYIHIYNNITYIYIGCM